MSISDPRLTKDRSYKSVDVCDIAINPKFLVKIQNRLRSKLLKNFFLQIVNEAMRERWLY
ncbi:GD22060 [Drosophila simulans]|uniref:GD22060 n=1 Tax=Drosophila simulans TaxID=7240 RepID=B4NV46_DROSI|nr:GD22060 [Drosophila simulans]